MVNSIGNGIKIAFEAIKLVFTRWYTYLIAVLYAAAAYILAELMIYIEKYYRMQQHPHLFQGIEGFGFDTYFDVFASIFKRGLWIGSIKVLMVPALIFFIDAIMSQYRREPISWSSLILKIFKYSMYSIPIMILWTAASLLIFDVLGDTIFFKLLPILVATFLGFYVAAAIDSKKIFVPVSEYLHILKSNFFNYCGFLLIWLPFDRFLSFAEMRIMDFLIKNELIVSFFGLSRFLFLFISFSTSFFILCAAITLMYLCTPKESHDQFNR